MNQIPTISVIVPIYKVEQYLRPCIDSILTQTFTDFELLLIDDGSPDYSGKICDEYAKKDLRIKVFHKENGGVSSARNLGIEQSKGEWICFIDADDLIKKDLFSTAYNIISLKNIDLYIFGCNSLKNEAEAELFSYKEGYYDINTFWKEQYHHLASWGYLFKKDIINTVHLNFNTQLTMSEDRVFMAKYFSHCNAIYSTSQNYYLYRLTESSACGSKMTYTKAVSQLKATQTLLNLYKECFQKTFQIILSDLIYNCLSDYIDSIAELNDKIYYKESQQNIRKIITTLKFENISIKDKIRLWLCSICYPFYAYLYHFKQKLRAKFKTNHI